MTTAGNAHGAGGCPFLRCRVVQFSTRKINYTRIVSTVSHASSDEHPAVSQQCRGVTASWRVQGTRSCPSPRDWIVYFRAGKVRVVTAGFAAHDQHFAVVESYTLASAVKPPLLQSRCLPSGPRSKPELCRLMPPATNHFPSRSNVAVYPSYGSSGLGITESPLTRWTTAQFSTKAAHANAAARMVILRICTGSHLIRD